MKEIPPLRLAALDTSPPLREGEDSAAAAAPILDPAKRGGDVERSETEGGNSEPTSRSRRKQGTTERARALRWKENEAEGALWQELKSRKLGGFHFTRQFPIGPYFADFACRKSRLIVEIDGLQHAESQYDRHRDEHIRALGYSTLRFWNHDVLRHRIAVCETILAALDGRIAESVTASDFRFVHAPRAHRSPKGTHP